MVLTRSLAKKTARGNSGRGPKTPSTDADKASMATAVCRDATGAVAKDRIPSRSRDVATRKAPKSKTPREESNHGAETETTRAHHGRPATSLNKLRRVKEDPANDGGLKPTFNAESTTVSCQKRRMEEDERNKENKAIARQDLPSTSARRVRRRISKTASDETETKSSNMSSLVAAEDPSSSASSRLISSRTEFSVDEIVATAALLQFASGKLHRTASMPPTSSQVESNRGLVSEVTLSPCNHASEQGLKRIGIPGIEAVMVLVGA
ncbi:hypothetical protein ACEPAH_9592 [Sanghuangporus vaninii]